MRKLTDFVTNAKNGIIYKDIILIPMYDKNKPNTIKFICTNKILKPTCLELIYYYKYKIYKKEIYFETITLYIQTINITIQNKNHFGYHFHKILLNNFNL